MVSATTLGETGLESVGVERLGMGANRAGSNASVERPHRVGERVLDRAFV